jgi:hypothetical protein
MVERPISFKAPMVRALLSGSKSQTRRTLKPQPVEPALVAGDWLDMHRERHAASDAGERSITPYAVGDVLWVREALQCDLMENFLTGERDTNAAVAYYAADDTEVVDRAGFNLAWVWKRGALPAMFMPRAYSRITLKVTGVKVERLQDISEADAIAEGVASSAGRDGRDGPEGLIGPGARAAFSGLWVRINGPGSWEANPWVVAISFERIPTEAPTG